MSQTTCDHHVSRDPWSGEAASPCGSAPSGPPVVLMLMRVEERQVLDNEEEKRGMNRNRNREALHTRGLKAGRRTCRTFIRAMYNTTDAEQQQRRTDRCGDKRQNPFLSPRRYSTHRKDATMAAVKRLHKAWALYRLILSERGGGKLKKTKRQKGNVG